MFNLWFEAGRKSNTIKRAIGVLMAFCICAGCTAEAGEPKSDCEGAVSSSCLLRPDDYRDWKGAAAVRIADIRSSSDYERVRIPGSVNFPVFALRAKSYLKSEKLLLVGAAYQRVELNAACALLTREGFGDIRYLAGGVWGWQDKLGPLLGDPNAIAELRAMTPADFVKEINSRPWALVDAAAPHAAPIVVRGVLSLRLQSNQKARDIPDALRELARSYRKEEPNLALLLIASPVETRGASLLPAELEGVFFLKGGRAALDQYLKANDKILEHLERKSNEKRCG